MLKFLSRMTELCSSEASTQGPCLIGDTGLIYYDVRSVFVGEKTGPSASEKDAPSVSSEICNIRCSPSRCLNWNPKFLITGRGKNLDECLR